MFASSTALHVVGDRTGFFLVSQSNGLVYVEVIDTIMLSILINKVPFFYLKIGQAI